MLASGFFGETMPKGMPLYLVTSQTILRSLLAAIITPPGEDAI
jgi:hypothetical protein